MESLGMILSVFGFIVMIVGGIWLLIVAFSESIWWGLGCLLCSGIVSLIFVILHFSEAKYPFLVQIVGLIFYVAGALLMGEPLIDTSGY